MQKKVSADFFRVKMPDDEPRVFTGLLAGLLKDKPNLADRNLRLGGYWYRLQFLEQKGSLWLGSFIRIRMDDLPGIAKLSGDTRELNLDQDEGLDDETSFVYTQRYGAIVIQRNFQAVRPGTVETYINKIADCDLSFEVILQRDAFERLGRMKLIRSFDFRLASPTNPVYKNVRAVRGILDSAEYLGALRAGVVLSMGRGKGSLTPSRIIDAARTLAQLHGRQAEVEKVLVKGSRGLPDEPLETIDLLEYRLVEEFKVETIDRRLPGPEIRKELASALSRQDEELREQFGKSKGR